MPRPRKRRPRAIYPQDVATIARRCSCRVDLNKVGAVLQEIHACPPKAKANPHYTTFICRATVLLYQGSVVTTFKRTHTQNSRKAANKRLALAFCIDSLANNGYEWQSNPEEVITDEIFGLIDGERAVAKIKAWVRKNFHHKG